MIFETGRIVAIEPKGVWVETIQRSACSSCQAQKGCGHGLLSNFGTSASHIWVLLDGRDPQSYSVGNEVRIGIPENVIARGAVFIYMVPLVAMITAVLIGHRQGAGIASNALCAIAGLLCGAAIVRLHSYQKRFDKRLQPVLMDDQTQVQIMNVYSAE